MRPHQTRRLRLRHASLLRQRSAAARHGGLRGARAAGGRRLRRATRRLSRLLPGARARARCALLVVVGGGAILGTL